MIIMHHVDQKAIMDKLTFKILNMKSYRIITTASGVAPFKPVSLGLKTFLGFYLIALFFGGQFF